MHKRPLILHYFVLFLTLWIPGIQTGLDGIISSPSKAFLTITANDDPNGLLKFAERSVDIPEDFKLGMEATTTKNLTVLRDQGSWGTIRVSQTQLSSCATGNCLLRA